MVSILHATTCRRITLSLDLVIYTAKRLLKQKLGGWSVIAYFSPRPGEGLFHLETRSSASNCVGCIQRTSPWYKKKQIRSSPN